MHASSRWGWLLSGSMVVALLGMPPDTSGADKVAPLKVVGDETVAGFAFPESVGCDAKSKTLYVSQFVSELKPAEKDGKGRIDKVSLTGKVLVERFLPAHGEILHKPKGIWVSGNRLWVTDIDVVWVFDLASRRGRKVELPGIQFANDPTVQGNALYVSDNRADQLFKVEPADFLQVKAAPKVTRIFVDKGINPNGLYPGPGGSVLMVGFKSDKEPRGIYSIGVGGVISTLARDVGRLDGVYRMRDGSLLVTDWNAGSLFRWSASGGAQTLATGFKGPADFCVLSADNEYLVVVPDLVKSELRMGRLAR